MSEESRSESRREVLSEFGADAAVLDELLAYNANCWDQAAFEGAPSLPLSDEAHLAVWRDYAAQAAALGVIPALQKRLVQLSFPVEEGVSTSDRYRGATLRGELPSESGALQLAAESEVELCLHPTQAGTIPVLQIADRRDFVSMVQAFTRRNEPQPIPDSMGACMISGLNNWDRIRKHRSLWAKDVSDSSDTAWSAEFKRLIPRKPEYQDRLILLSSGPYSAVPAATMGLSDNVWLEASMTIRREHECTHYFTLRVLGSMRNNLMDELIADYVGLVAAFGQYDAWRALTFLGLEDYPRTSPGGRVENYRGEPALSAGAFEVIMRLVIGAANNLESFNQSATERYAEPEAIASTILALASRTLEELAEPGAEDFLRGAV